MANAENKTHAPEDHREPFSAFIVDEETAQVVRPIAEEYGWPKKKVQKGTLSTANRAMSIVEAPKLLVVDMAKAKDPVDDITALLETLGTQTYVIALGDTNDVTLYRKLMEVGVKDYLLKPLSPETFSSAISRGFVASNQDAVTGEGRRVPNKMCSFVGVRGGIGSSLLATNIAWIIANELKRSTALLDLDIHFGTSALSFDLEPGRGLADALEDPSRLDEVFIERAMVRVNDKLAILGSEMPFDENFLPDPTALNQLVSILKSTTGYLVVDMPRSLAGDQAHVLEESNDIFLVSELSLAATRDTIRFLGFLNEVAPESKVHVVVNPSHTSQGEEVNQKDFEASIEHKVDWFVPVETKLVLNAVKKGKVLPEVGKESRLVKTLREMAQDMTGIRNRQKSKAKWVSLGR